MKAVSRSCFLVFFSSLEFSLFVFAMFDDERCFLVRIDRDVLSLH
jgi:hypothetical protein